MSDKTRWRYGGGDPVVAAVDPGTVIEIGNLVWQDVDNAKPASMIVEASTGHGIRLEQRFAKLFLGVAMQQSHSGDTKPIRVATTGVFGFDCLSTRYELGDLMGIRHITAVQFGDSEIPEHRVEKLANQEVEKVSDSRYAIGRVAKREPSPVTEVLVDIRSTVMTGGV